MEDVHRVIPLFDGKENVAFFGVYDGHGGRSEKADVRFGMDWIIILRGIGLQHLTFVFSHVLSL